MRTSNVDPSLRRRTATTLILLFATYPYATAYVPPATTRVPQAVKLQEEKWSQLVDKVKVANGADPYSVVGQTQQQDHPPTLTIEIPDFFNSEEIVKAVKGMTLSYSALPLWEQIGLGAAPILFMTFLILYNLSFPPEDYRADLEPYPRGSYDPIQAQAYYQKYPNVVLSRALQLFRLSNKFLVNFLLDKYIFKREEKMREQRAQELLELITRLGPTAIKIGQAVSVRPDIIPREYADALSTLQDQVPPFSSSAAREIIRSQLGNAKFEEFQGLTSDPIASASIGQVYKAKLQGKDVAVKVQRPNVCAEIALDLYIVREFAPFYQKYIAKSQTDLQALANEWGRGFIAELDYRQEAKKTMRFNEEMKKRELTAVCAPVVLPEYSTQQILVSEFVDGVRIDSSDEDDIPRLCSVALNAYLIMLLELQSLHCDPHPGNLLRTKDGRLCILDFGMTLDVDPELQYSLLEYLAHCTSDNYDKVPEDLVNMGFLKPDKLDYAKRSGFLEPLIYFLKEAGKGGGAKSVRERIIKDFRQRYPGLDDEGIRKVAREEMKAQMEEVAKRESLATGITTEVEELQKRNRDSFTIPEWFVYVSRTIGTLEGVSLQSDPDFSLVKSSFPYITKRLLADDSPRAQRALKEMIYGAGDSIDVDRIGDIVDGFSSFTTTTKSINMKDGKELKKAVDKDKNAQAEATITLVKDSADILLDPRGNLVQSLLVEESAAAASAQFKDNLRETLVDGPQRFRDSLPLGVGGFLPSLPFEGALAPFVKKTESEEKAQKLVSKLTTLAASSQGARKGGTTIDLSSLNEIVDDLEPEQAAYLSKELRENLPKYTPLLGQLGTRFVSTLLQRASDNIDVTLQELESNINERDPLMQAAARGLSTAARQGASALKQQNSRQVEDPEKSDTLEVYKR